VCARIFYLLLAALFVFIAATVAAFRYLDWWQALLVAAGTFLVLALVCRWLIRRAIRRTVGQLGDAARGLFGERGQVLRGATADVHAVRPTSPPADDLPGLRWYEVEATIFPDPSQSDPTNLWDLTALRLVPADASPPTPFSEPARGEYRPHDLVLLEEGKPVISVDGQVTGPRRLRFRFGVPPAVHDLQFRYDFEQFGLFRIPPALPTGPTL
jgi:hypothetical protein